MSRILVWKYEASELGLVKAVKVWVIKCCFCCNSFSRIVLEHFLHLFKTYKALSDG